MTLDKLLYILCEKGWKPYGIPRVKNVVALNHCICFSKRTIFGIEFFEYTLRSLVSKESGLWQFCCENKIVKEDCSSIELYIMSEGYGILRDSSYQFWLMNCSLKDESELEDFLLQNIKVDGE